MVVIYIGFSVKSRIWQKRCRMWKKVGIQGRLRDFRSDNMNRVATYWIGEDKGKAKISILGTLSIRCLLRTKLVIPVESFR